MQQDDLEGLIELIQGFVVLTFLAWLGFGVATAIVAVRRGHSGLGGFGLGILLGPFGLVIELLRIPDRVALAPKGITRGENKRCPYCDEIIRNAAIRCRYCGSDLVEEPAQAEGSSEKETEVN